MIAPVFDLIWRATLWTALAGLLLALTAAWASATETTLDEFDLLPQDAQAFIVAGVLEALEHAGLACPRPTSRSEILAAVLHNGPLRQAIRARGPAPSVTLAVMGALVLRDCAVPAGRRMETTQ